jgi:hypothetical protein
VGGFHQQVGDQRQSILHRHDALAFSAARAASVKSGKSGSEAHGHGAALKFRGLAGDDQSMTRVLMAALLLVIPLLTSWILARRVAAPDKS